MKKTFKYLFGVEKCEGLPTEYVSASWNLSKVDILFIQTGFINFWDKTKGDTNKDLHFDTKCDVHPILNLTLHLSALGGGDFC